MERPIGYWLKHLDRLIETAFDHVLAAEELTRRHWQVMNVLLVSPRDASALAEALRPFALDDTVSELTHRGWLTQDDAGSYALTPTGRAGHAAVEENVHSIRATVLTGLTEDEYRTTVRVLRQMAENLEHAAGLHASTASA